MNQVTVRKGALLERLRENRVNHRVTFERALDGYRVALLKELKTRVRELGNGKTPNRVISLPEPEDHTDDYDRVITMVEMSVADQIELSAQEFARYVMDDWGWQQAFTQTSSRYIQ